VTNPFLGVDENENDIIVRAPEINRSPLDRILNGSYSPEVQEIVKKAVETREITHEGQLIAMPYMIDNRLIGLTVLSGQVTEEDIVLAMNFKGMVETAIPHVMKSQEDNKKFDYDALTEIPNENLFRTELFRDFCQVGRGRVSNYSLIYIDIDHFKRINDKFTHDAGDDILKMLAAQLVSSVRGGDIVARLHGEEFVIGLPNTALIDALRIADSIRQSVSEHNFTVGNRKIPITISMGVANLPIHLKQVVQGEEDDAAAIFIHMADAALYAAKGEIENAYLVGKKIPSGDRNRVAVLMNGEYMLAPQAIEALCKQAANDAIAEKAENKGGVGVNPVEDSAGANAGSNGGGRQG
jgi:diguanylate cyclase (GGDEF)-like protein